jgi:hypothetical protein
MGGRKPKPRESYECGTYQAYQAHIKRGDHLNGGEVDEACRRANREYNTERRHGKAERERAEKYRRAEYAAMKRLAEDHKATFLEYLLEEQWKLDHEGNEQ